MGLTQVTGKGITDGTIFDVDVHASAAIAGSKIDPDFGSQNVATTGTLASGNLTITSTQPFLSLQDSNNENDFEVGNAGGLFRIRDVDAAANRLTISSAGVTDIAGNLNVGGNVSLGDSQYLNFGASADLSINHSGSHSVILEQGTGNLSLQCTAGEIQLAKANTFEHMVRAIPDGAVMLYHDNSLKFETTATGIKVDPIVTIDGSTPRLQMKPTANEQSHRIEFYNAADSMVSRIYGDPSTGNLEIQTGSSGNESAVKCIANGAVELYHNDSKKFETTSGGAKITGVLEGDSNLVLKTASGSSNSVIFKSNNELETLLQATVNGSVELYHDSSKKFETTSGGASITGNLTVSGSLTNGVTATTQSAGDNSTKIATTAYTDTAIANLADSAPSTLNTLNELAAALGDDANFSTTVTNSIATKMALAGGTFTGDVTFDGATAGRDILFDRSRDSLVFKDNAVAEFGTGIDLQIFHDGSHSKISNSQGYLVERSNQYKLSNLAEDHTYIKVPTNEGGVELYYDNSKKFETTANGIIATGNDAVGNILIGDLRLKQTSGDTTYVKWDASHSKLEFMDNVYAMFGNGNDLEIFHNGNNSFIRHVGTGNLHIKPKNNEEGIVLIPDGAVQLYHNNSKKFETLTDGVLVTGKVAATGDLALTGSDGQKIRIGESNDLEIFHDGSHSKIVDSGTGHLQIFGSVVQIGKADGSELGFTYTSDGSIQLRHNNVTKFETTSSGVNVTGALTINGAALGGGNPTGTVISYAGSSAPTGYLKANGDTIPNGSGTVQGVTEDFSDLYAIVGSSLPDLRGEFVRGLDDSRGVDSGRSIRSSQSGQNVSHSHTTNSTLEESNSNAKDLQGQFNGEERDGRPFGVFYTVGGRGRDFDGGDGDYIGFDGRHRHGTTSSGGSEARPRNVALLMCIKY